jgi:hypothetical protein
MSRALLSAAFSLFVFCLAGASYSQGVTDLSDGYFHDRDNDDGRLIVFVAGLAGEKSWSSFIPFVSSDASLRDFDYVVYETPKSLGVEENVHGLRALLTGLPRSYPAMVYVGHSIGGIIVKRLILLQLNQSENNLPLPDMVVTYGTPFDTDTFNITTTRNVLGQMAWAIMPTLWREVFDLERLADISRAWRTAVTQAPLDQIRFISVFGVEDTIAPVTHEHRSEETIFLQGDHMGIVSPTDAEACSLVVLKTALRDRTADLSALPCVLQ